jgi:hypothetical protein
VQAQTGPCVVTVHDDGRGIDEFQDLLTLGKSGWNTETQVTEDPAGTGFFALCRSEVEVHSGNRFVRLMPAVFLGRASAHVEQLPETVRGTRIRFTRISAKEQLVATSTRRPHFTRLRFGLRQLLEHFVHHGPDGAQRMILPHPILRRYITEDVTLLLISSAHAFSYHATLWIRSSFSAAC